MTIREPLQPSEYRDHVRANQALERSMINSQLRTLGMTLIWSQLFLALSWVAYLYYLPRLVRDAGLSLQAVPWLLAMDQAIFVLTDCAIGARVGKMAKTIGRIGPYILALAGLSSLAFLAIPWVTPLLGPNPTATLALIGVWAAAAADKSIPRLQAFRLLALPPLASPSPVDLIMRRQPHPFPYRPHNH
jgi:hypothetical protein